MSDTARSQTFLTNGLVAYYPFNGNANDASGNTNNGTVSGAILTSDRFGNTNSAYAFNGTSSYIGFSKLPLTQTDNWTMSVWINPASTNQKSAAISLGKDNDLTGNGFEFGMTAANPTGTGNQLAGFLSGVTWLNSGFGYTATNKWYHIVIVLTTNVTLPLSQWRWVSTNVFNADGSFSNGLPIAPGTPQFFYRLQTQ